MGKFSDLIKLGDAAIEAAEKLSKNFKGKSVKDIAAELQENVKDLASKEGLDDLKKAMIGLSPNEIKAVLQESFKGLSKDEAAELTDAITTPGKMREYLNKKVDEKKQEKEQTRQAVKAAKRAQADAEAAARKANPESTADTAKKVASGLGKAFQMGNKLRQKRQDGNQKQNPAPPKKQPGTGPKRKPK